MAAYINNMSRKGKLLNPRDLARRVTSLHDPAEGIEALRTQVNLARGRKNKTSWLAALAEDLDALQFHSRNWIRDNVCALPPQRRRPASSDPPTGTCRDVRLKDNPNLPCRQEVVRRDSESPSQNAVVGRDIEPPPTRSIPAEVGGDLATSPDRESSEGDIPPEVEAKLLYSPTKPVSPVRPTVRTPNKERVRRRPSGSREPATKKPRLGKNTQCPVHSCTSDISRVHAFRRHLPGVFQLEVSGEDITTRRIGALKLASRWILGQRGTLSGLMAYLESTGSVERADDLEPELVIAMEELSGLLQEALPVRYVVENTGNHVAALLHWRVLLLLSSLLEAYQCDLWRKQFGLAEEELAQVPGLPVGFDSHCHLDRTRHELGKPDASLEGIVAAVTPRDPFEVQTSRVVGVFCDPPTYPSAAGLRDWVSQGVVPVVGIHPRQPLTEEGFVALANLLEEPDVVGLGEVGLDHKEPHTAWVSQMLKLDRALGLLKSHHILVLHARGATSVSDEALLTLMYQLLAHPNVHREQLIHVHCFTGTVVVLEKWLQAFPHTYFGLTSLAARLDLGGAIRRIPRQRLLLETDAPYFQPPGFRRSTPGLLGMVAASLSEVLGMPWQEVLEVTARNADRLYVKKLPPETTSL